MSKVIHFEVPAKNPEKLAEFYTKVFNWKIKEWRPNESIKEENRYWIIEAGPKDEPGINGGMYKRQEPIAKGGINAFIGNISISDIDKVAKLIKENKGTVREIMDIPRIGRTAAAKDPEGNNFTIFEAKKDSMMKDM